MRETWKAPRRGTSFRGKENKTNETQTCRVFKEKLGVQLFSANADYRSNLKAANQIKICCISYVAVY